MSNGDEDTESADEPAETDFEARLDDAAETIEAAETERDLDDAEATLEAIESDLESADLPEPDDDEESDYDVFTDRIEDLRDEIEATRGPYIEDVTEVVEDVAGTIRETRWTDDGADSLEAAVSTFIDDVAESVDASVETEGEAAALLEGVAETLSGLDLDADEDAETIQSLLTAAETLDDAVEAAESWEDLSVREQLAEEGFYEVLTSERRKDYPPEWSAVKLYEKQYQETGDPVAVEMILLALDTLPGGNDHFMQENILDSLERIAPPEAFDDLIPLASKRNQQAVSVLGKIGDPEALDSILDFIDGDGDVALQLTTLQAVGAIGSDEATQTVANRLAADEPDIRSAAARALGRIGDTRAIDPLADVLDDDPVDSVRASAAWALVQIGTERALEAVEDHADDAYLVQAEAEKAALSS